MATTGATPGGAAPFSTVPMGVAVPVGRSSNARIVTAGVVVALVVVAAVGALVVTIGGDDDPEGQPGGAASGDEPADALGDLVAASGLEDPATVELPPPADGPAAAAWLSGEGAPALALVDAGQQLWTDGTAACEGAAEALDGAGSPDALLAAAAGTPDPVTADLLLGLHQGVGDALGTCGDAAAFDPAVNQLAWQWAIVDRRLRELGVGG